MIELGVYEKRVVTLGNLKYDLSGDKGKSDRNIKINPGIRIVAGSTHRGEEKILLLAFKKLMERYDNLSFVIAPRDIDRGKEILDLATSLGFTAACRSEGKQSSSKNVYILNIIGELVEYYHTCDIAFVGGSLVEAGGHNPIEPAITGVPVLFGPHMEDFSEISEDLLASTAAIRVYDSDSCYQALHALLKDGELRNKMGLAAKSYIREKQGVTEKHLQMIRNFL
jgi:3-deoxy-D-manno-octulosonic-acid transferase